MEEKLLFLNESVTKKSNDVIGFETYVDKLNDVIDSGAKMIAITSPFGSGKTSIIDLLIEKRKENKREKVIKIPMWSQLNNLEQKSKVNELHKNFLYQIGSAIDFKKGTYLNRRLSSNYGLLKLHVNKPIYWIFLIVSLLFATIGWLVKNYEDNVIQYIPALKNVISYVFPVSCIISLVCFIIILTGSEILFSSKDSENKRVINSDEIIDLYRNVIIIPKSKARKRIIRFVRRIPGLRNLVGKTNHRYIIVVEDLDRTDNSAAIKEFLMELRKYYVVTINDEEMVKNNVSFIVNIKSESDVFGVDKKNNYSNVSNEGKTDVDSLEVIKKEASEKKDEEINKKQDLLYAKLFDFVLNLQTINIVDYDTILKGLLKEKEESILKLPAFENEKILIDIPGMQWIIRGEDLNIRIVKSRLNRAFLIYETLVSRFLEIKNEIDFEKAAVASYITTTYELEFSKTDDKAFDKLIEYDIKKELKLEKCIEELNTQNDDYGKDIVELIKSQLIGEDYRMYFYNYPKNSKIYNNNEVKVQKAILYNENCDDLDNITLSVISSNRSVLVDSFKKLDQLNIQLPKSIIHTESLFLFALDNYETAVIDVFQKMDVNDETIDTTISEIISILQYDKDRKTIKPKIINKLCLCWEKTFNEKNLLLLRETICREFSNEILLYKKLFDKNHNIISLNEMGRVTPYDGIQLLNIESKNFSITYVDYIVSRFAKIDNQTNELRNEIKDFLVSVKEVFRPEEIIDYYLDFMISSNQIVSELEEEIRNVIINRCVDQNNDEESESQLTEIPFVRKEEIFNKYHSLINSLAVEDLSENTLEIINSVEDYSERYNYSNKVAQKLYDNSYYITYILICANNDYYIDFSDERIKDSLQEASEWLMKNNEELVLIRNYIIKTSKVIENYCFLFTGEYPVLTKEDFSKLVHRNDVTKLNVFEFLPNNITESKVDDVLVEYLNNGNLNNNTAFEVINQLIKFNETTMRFLFYSLDFTHAFQYYRFSSKKKESIKETFESQLRLDDINGQLEFMEKTMFLDEKIDGLLTGKLLEEDKQDRYVEIINNKLGPWYVYSSTINNILSFKKHYSFHENTGVNKKLLKDKHYTHYVISTTSSAREFKMGDEKLSELLWNTYIEILSSPEFENTKRYMISNYNFLEKVRDKRSYGDFSNETLMYLTKVKQDSDLIEKIFELDNDFAIKYFSSISSGFVDYKSAKRFVDLLESHSKILESDLVKDNVYDRLLDPGLKRRYTKMRKAENKNH